MPPTKKNHGKKHNRTQRSRGGRRITGPFAKVDDMEKEKGWANVTFSRRWFQDIPESNKGTLTVIRSTENSEKIKMAKLTVCVSDANMKKFQIPGPIVVPEVKFEKTKGFSHGAYLKITADAIGRPDLRSVAYVASDDDAFELQQAGGGFESIFNNASARGKGTVSDAVKTIK